MLRATASQASGVCAAGLDYKRSAFGPCTAPGQPAATCKVIYTEDILADDGVLDEGRFHGTNVAGIVAGKVVM